MKTEFPDAQSYAAETAQFPAMQLIDIPAQYKQVTDNYRNTVLADINDACLRLAIFEGEYRWHHHPHSDELFLVVEGAMEIDFEDGQRVCLAPWQCLVVSAGVIHRTRAVGRTVNLTFEKQAAETRFVEG